MSLSVVMIRDLRALAFPGFRGGPAPYAGEVLSVIMLGRNTRRRPIDAHNDNGARRD